MSDARQRHHRPGRRVRPPARTVDPGRRGLAATGLWARAFTTWYDDVTVVAVEPSEAMRARSVHQPVLAGAAEDIPVDAVWISTVIHHVPDLERAAEELHRVLRPGAWC